MSLTDKKRPIKKIVKVVSLTLLSLIIIFVLLLTWAAYEWQRFKNPTDVRIVTNEMTVFKKDRIKEWFFFEISDPNLSYTIYLDVDGFNTPYVIKGRESKKIPGNGVSEARVVLNPGQEVSTAEFHAEIRKR